MNELKKQAPELGLGMLPGDVWESILEYARPESEEDMKKKKKNEEESLPTITRNNIGPINTGRGALCRCDGCPTQRQCHTEFKGFCKKHCRLFGNLCANTSPFALIS